MSAHAPLEDPDYVPQHRPIDGVAPDVVEKWGAPSQLRWFIRYQGDLKPQPHSYWARFYCDSTQHLGLCCAYCIEVGEYIGEDECCCQAFKARGEVSP